MPKTKSRKRKKSPVGWMQENIANTLTFYKGTRIPFKTYKDYGIKKVRITIEEV